MSTAVLYMSMSLDGYIAGPNDEVDNPGGSGFDRLYGWFGYALEGGARQLKDEYEATGAVLVGRRTAEQVDHLDELSTTPDNLVGEHCFTITHPFHPLSGQTFPLLSQRFAWGEERVFFLDPQSHEVRSLPRAWTNLALPDPFLVVAAGKTVLRWSDLQQLRQLLRQKQTHGQEEH
jgi:dihydrofolate reductase